MPFVIRLILAFSILWQSLVRLTGGTCAAKPNGAGLAATTALCDCCRDADGNPIPCPMAADPSIGCNCPASQDRDPAPPPADTTAKQIPHLVALPISFLITPIAVPSACGFRGDRSHAATNCAGRSIQSILCVWLT